VREKSYRCVAVTTNGLRFDAEHSTFDSLLKAVRWAYYKVRTPAFAQVDINETWLVFKNEKGIFFCNYENEGRPHNITGRFPAPLEFRI
jgi:hypothetical protein